MSVPAVDRRWNRVALVAFAALLFALWLLQHPYPGIYHDAQLYTLQALAHLRPAELSNDLYLRFGSQDQFTFFSPLYALAIRTLGLGPAAALLTFLFHCAFAVALVLFARRVLPPRFAYLGVALVCVVPLTYGAGKVFYLMEDFVTPRLLAQALVLAGLAALLDRRYLLASCAAALAALVHPIVALTGVALAAFSAELSRRQRTILLATAAIAVGAALAVLAIRERPVRFDADWWQLIHGGLPYLFPFEWRRVDWSRVIVLGTVLYAGMRRLPEARARGLCRAALIAMTAGIALAIVGGDLLRIVLITQLQPWRILWLASAIALLLSPVIAVEWWRGGTPARIGLVALLAAFLLADERFALPAALLAAVVVLVAERVRAEFRALRLLLFGAFALLALAVVVNLTSSSIVARGRFDQGGVPEWLLGLRTVSGTGLLAALAACAAGWIVARGRAREVAALALVSGALAVVFVCATLPQWTRTPYSRDNHAAFASWRALIPPRTEVLWLDQPMAAWALLERPSYASKQQAASALFSRAAAVVVRDRLLELVELFPDAPPFSTPDEAQSTVTLSALCAATSVRFVVTRAALDQPPIASAPDSLPADLRGKKLYACAR